MKRRRRMMEDLDQDIRDHLEREIEDNIARGMPLEEARYAAMRKFGSVTRVKEDVREVWSVVWLEQIWQDIHYAVRMLRKSPGFAAIAVLTLALGIGANTSLFSVVNGVLLNPLPYPHPDQVVTAASWFPGYGEGSISYPDFLDWVRLNHTFAALAAYRRDGFNLIGQGDAEQVTAVDVSSSFFPLLGVNPILGRNFSSSEDQLGGPPAVILSGGFWKTKLGSSPDIIGKTLNLDGTGYTIVGVVPENFYFCCSSTDFLLSDVYVTIGASKDPAVRDRRMTPSIWAVGRIKQGVTLAQARADMDGVARNLAAVYPDIDKDSGIVVTPLKQVMVRDIRPFLLVLLAAVGFVLLIACVNVANLLLARSTGRGREFAIRAALGASRGRVVRQLLTETILLALSGGTLGLLVAWWGTRAALAAVPSALPRANDVRLDPRVLLFTLAISLLAGVLFGLAPALKTSHPALQETLKEGGRGSSGRYRTQNTFVIVEMALAVVLLIGAGLTIRTLVGLWGVNPGFDPHKVLSFRVAFPPSISNADPSTIRASLRQFTQKIASVPGVSAVSLTTGAKPLDRESALIFWREGQPKPAAETSMPFALWYRVGPDYLKVMTIPLRRGRFLTAQDDANSPGVCVIDEDFARQFFGDEDPIGKRLNFSLVYNQPLQIVGVVGHVKHYGLDETAHSRMQAQFYMSPLQLPDDQLKTFAISGAGYVIRTQGSPSAFADAVREALRQFNSEAVLHQPETMDSIIARSLASRRFAMILLAVFAALALVLASIGIYGVISYISGQRTHEIGIRIALGAERADILKMVLGQGARLAVAGVVIGLAAAAGLTRLMSKILYGVSATDPLTFAAVAIVLTLIALAACYIPARRAMRINSTVALRYE